MWRWLAAARHPGLLAGKEAATVSSPPLLAYYLSTHPAPLRRLKWLLLEQSGTVEDQGKGLLLYNPRTRRLSRCGDGAIGAGSACMIFVHGTHGDEESFTKFLAFVAKQRRARGLSLLVFRFPNDGSLARAGCFLRNEMARAVRSPDRASFVCHSAGGLVFRYYAEKLRGGFGCAALLGTPHGGTRMTSVKTLVDAAAFADCGLKVGLPAALAATVGEGKGDLTPDVEPDSLFLRHLGHDARLARRYHVVYGRYLRSGRALGLWASYLTAKVVIEKAIRNRPGPPWIKERGLRMVRGLRLTDEVLNGDSGHHHRLRAPGGAGWETATTCHHQALKTDEGVLREVTRYLLKPP